MVSTQNTFFATNPVFPSILANVPFQPKECVPTVLDRSSVNRTPAKPLPSPSVVKIIAKHADILNKHADLHARALLHGLAFKGTTPNSVSDLISLGANRNHDAIKEDTVDETAAYENDVAYYKVLLEARERHREAIRAKLHALRTVRAKRPGMYRKRAIRNHNPGKPAARPSQSQANSKPPKNMLDESDAWPGSCASPASTDIESDVSSVLDDDSVSVEKPVVYAV